MDWFWFWCWYWAFFFMLAFVIVLLLLRNNVRNLKLQVLDLENALEVLDTTSEDLLDLVERIVIAETNTLSSNLEDVSS